jgi:hypothetical protein
MVGKIKRKGHLPAMDRREYPEKLGTGETERGHRKDSE